MTTDDNHFGFTLLEVMIAMAIIAIALTAVLGSQSQSVSLAGETKFTTTASLLAQKKLAEITLKNLNGLHSADGDFGKDFPGYFWKTTVRNIMFDGGMKVSSHLKKIDLVISWSKDDQYQYHLRLYRFDPKT